MSWDVKFLQLAKFISGWSKDPSTQVGAVLIDEKRRIVGTGYNGFPRGVEDNASFYEDKEEKYPRVVHAELNALLGNRTEGATLYVYPLPPCPECVKAIIQSGVARVVISPVDPASRWAVAYNKFSLPMLKQAKIEVTVCGV